MTPQIAARTGAIALTFDDGPDPAWTPRLLDALGAAEAQATFFVIAPRAVRHPEVLDRILEDGHRVELHCDRHVRHSELDDDALLRDVERAQSQLRPLGVQPTLWRTPWGVETAGTHAVAERFGLRLVGWSADTHDWRGDAAETMRTALSPDLAAGAIVLAHDGIGPGARRRHCAETVALVDLLAQDARARELHLTALGDDGRPA